jgi:uncharacterized membrane protein
MMILFFTQIPTIWLLHFVLRAIHILASAAMFGAMFYSFTVLHPRAKRFFQQPRDFEEFITFLSNGARWKVLGGLALIAITGALLVLLQPPGPGHLWTAIIFAKSTVLLIAITFFCYVSWHLWPARIFASADELPRVQRLFRLVGLAMVAMITIEFLLAIVAHGI